MPSRHSEVTALQARHSRRSPEQQLWPRSCTLHRPGGAILPTRAKDQEKLERLAGRLRRQGFLTKEDMDISQRASKADQKLFQAIRNNPHHVHVLYRLLPELKKTGYNTRTRAHKFFLLPKNNSNFLPRMLYIDIY